jgi:hypothetical protein
MDSSIVGNAAATFRHQTRYVMLKPVVHVERACGEPEGNESSLRNANLYPNFATRLKNFFTLVIMILACNSRHSIL